MSLADLGAGDGALLVALANANLLDTSAQMIAVDLSEERCSRLRENTDFQVICADVTNIPQLQNNSIDFIICTQVIEHVEEMGLMNEIKRIMNKKGTLYIASVIKKKYGWWYYKTKTGEWGLDPTHLREYSSKEHFEDVIKNAGFEILETEVTKLKLSVAEFIVRRVLTKISNKNFNGLFLKNKILDYTRKAINISPPGYYIIEIVAKYK
jgi:ubiquinone/menaquinone biosynthesis C-methylase UbiE